MKERDKIVASGSPDPKEHQVFQTDKMEYNNVLKGGKEGRIISLRFSSW